MKKILLLTAGFGEGHNSAARGIRDGLLRLAGDAVQVEVHDVFSETYGIWNDLARTSYMALINNAPQRWASVYRWLDGQSDMRLVTTLLWLAKNYLRRVLERFQPDAVVSVYPIYPQMLARIFGPITSGRPKRVVIITDSITVNGIWFHCSADHFLVANQATAEVLARGGVPLPRITVTGFPVSPLFTDSHDERPQPGPGRDWHVLCMISPGKSGAPELVRRLAALPHVRLVVTVGENVRLLRAVEHVRATSAKSFEVIPWSDELPRLLRSSHLLISKAGGAITQEAIAAGCPIIVNQIVPGQEEGNARLVAENRAGTVAISNSEVIAAVDRAFANEGAQWREWSANVATLSKPAAAMTIAEFLLALE